MEFLFGVFPLQSILSGGVIIGGTILLALATYFAARALLIARAEGEARELAGSVIFRVSALHGLILALVFADELVTLNSLKHTVSHEAAIVADVFYDLKRYDEGGTLQIRTAIAEYIGIVVEEEWERLATRGELSDEAWARWVFAYESILSLEPASVRQDTLKPIIVNYIREVSELRRARLAAATSSANPFFLAAAIVGVLLTAMSFFTYAPGAVNLLLLSVFGAYTGLVIFFVLVFANPYLEPGAIEPIGFRNLLEGEIRALWKAAALRSDAGG